MSAPPSSPSPSPADPVRRLLDVADAIITFGMVIYTYPEFREVGRGRDAYVERYRQLHDLAAAARAVVGADLGPRAPLADVERRVADLTDVCGKVMAWAFRHRGLKPPKWPATDEEADDPRGPDWPPEVMRAEAERAELRRAMAEARERLERLRALGAETPRQSAAPAATPARETPPPPRFDRPDQPTAKYCAPERYVIRWEGQIEVRPALWHLFVAVLASPGHVVSFDELLKTVYKARGGKSEASLRNDVSELNGRLSQVKFPWTLGAKKEPAGMKVCVVVDRLGITK
jgi:hypothetical protein